VPPGLRWPDIRRTRIFGRIRRGPGVRTTVVVTHPTAADAASEIARPTLTLLAPDGQRRSVTELELPPHGSRHADLDDLFPDAADIVGADGHGTLRVRDTGARLYGYYFVETDGARTVPICHLLGG